MPTTTPWILLRCAALAPLATAATLHAQPVSNTQQVLAQCGTNTSVPPPIGSSNTLTATGTCTTTQGGTGSVNAATSYILAAGGVVHVINTADAEMQTHLGNPGGARAQGVADFAYPMNDIIFTSTANPAMVGPVTASLNFVVQLHASVSGPADPISTTLPRSFNSVRAILGSVTTIGGYDLRPSGPITTGALAGYPNDYSPLHLTTPSQTFTLTQPVTVQFIAQCSQSVLYNPVAPSPRSGSADTDVRISYPCGTPVFNLPPGSTANSVSLGIVNNIWVNGPCGPTCDPIDFNGDGLFPDTADIDDFLSVFSGGPCSTGTCGDIDFNNDGLFPDTSDIDSLLSVFSGGPCL
ncbi:MAG: hypothetical protein U0637_07430 [Phycisphaerales bacterium]